MELVKIIFMITFNAIMAGFNLSEEENIYEPVKEANHDRVTTQQVVIDYELHTIVEDTYVLSVSEGFVINPEPLAPQTYLSLQVPSSSPGHKVLLLNSSLVN